MPEVVAVCSATTRLSQAMPSAGRRPMRRCGRRPGQDHPADQAEAGHATRPGRLDEALVHAPDPVQEVEVQREDRPDRDQGDLRGLADAEPDDEDRHEGQVREHAQRLHRRVDHLLHDLQEPGGQAEQEAGGDADGEATHDAPEGDGEVLLQLARPHEVGARPPHLHGRGCRRTEPPLARSQLPEAQHHDQAAGAASGEGAPGRHTTAGSGHRGGAGGGGGRVEGGGRGIDHLDRRGGHGAPRDRRAGAVGSARGAGATRGWRDAVGDGPGHGTSVGVPGGGRHRPPGGALIVPGHSLVIKSGIARHGGTRGRWRRHHAGS